MALHRLLPSNSIPSRYKQSSTSRVLAYPIHLNATQPLTEPEAEYLGHLLNVEIGDPRALSGGYALWYDRTVRHEQISLDRATTLKEFRQGRRRYRETFAGGCAKVGLCDKRADDPMNLECLLNDCKNLVIQLPKFERIIRIQAQAVKELDSVAPDLPETRIEKDILIRMQERKKRILNENAAKAEQQSSQLSERHPQKAPSRAVRPE